MARKKHHRRATMTPWRVAKALIVFGPPAAFAYNAYNNASGSTGQKIVNGGLAGAIQAFTGLNVINGNWYPNSLVYGWGGAVAVAVLSKLKLGRFFRI